MDPHGRIYKDAQVPTEDAARLQGFLEGRAEADEKKRLEAEAEELRRKLEQERAGE